jgi:hypothetical protein
VHPTIGRQLTAERHQRRQHEAETTRLVRQAGQGSSLCLPAGRGARRNGSTAARPAVVAMYVGLALTVVATTVPYVDRATSNTLVDHIRAGYPAYTQARIDTAATTYEVYLSVLGVLGVAGWLWAVRAVTTGRRWARGAATALFALATSIALTDLLIKDTSGDTGLPALLGWVGVLPCLPGLLAVVLLWRTPSQARPTPPSARAA